MVFRSATADDLAGLKALAHAAWKFTYRHIYSLEYIEDFVERTYTPKFHSLLLARMALAKHFMELLVVEGRLSGIADVDLDDGGAHLTRFYLRPDLVGKGYGAALMAHTEGLLRAAGCTELDLTVHRDNRLGINFYERKGFVRATHLDNLAEGDLGYTKNLKGVASMP